MRLTPHEIDAIKAAAREACCDDVVVAGRGIVSRWIDEAARRGGIVLREDVLAATREAIEASARLSAHLGRLRDRVAPVFPLAGSVMANWPDEDRERLHALLRMFEQLHDLVARRVFRGALLLSGEDPTSLSARNLYRRLEAIGALQSSDAWLDLSTTRNLLVHDYPVSTGQQVMRANRVWLDLPILLAATDHVIDFIHAEGLLA